MAAQSDFAKHGAVALSEVAAFGGFCPERQSQSTKSLQWVGKGLTNGGSKRRKSSVGKSFCFPCRLRRGDAVSRLYDIVVATAACTF
jgi:hypothetical protein